MPTETSACRTTVEDLHDHELEAPEADGGEGDRGWQRRLVRPLRERLDGARERRRRAGDEHLSGRHRYSVTETLGNGGAVDPAVWETSSSADCAGSLAAGDEKTCTITNKRKPKLTVVKVIEGGNGASFDLAVNGSTVLENVGGSGGQVTNTYPVGTDYTRHGDAGRRRAVDPAVWETSSSADCAGSLAAGDEKTCTITNKRKPKLTVVKVIEGGNGASFDLKVNGRRCSRTSAARRPGDEHLSGRHRLQRHGDAGQRRRRARPSGRPAPARTAPARSRPATRRPARSRTSESRS